jgi:polyisoprenoid-binding protein YceI
MATYKIDAAHSEVTFKVKHLMISTVTGKFTQFDATLEKGDQDDLTAARITFEADIESINTNNEQRDAHLKSEDFFAGEQHPKLTFTSTSIDKKSDDEYLMHGNLTIRGVTKLIDLKVEYNGEVVDPYGQTKCGFEINGKISRHDFGLTWNAVTEAGGVVVSDEVKLHLNIQMIKQA